MDRKTQENIELADVFSMFTYLDDAVGESSNGNSSKYEGWDLDSIVTDLEISAQSGNMSKNNIELVQSIKSAIKTHPEWSKAVLMDVSKTNNTKTWTDDYIQGVTFKLGDDYYVAFRGTGDGRWKDNSKGLSLITSEMQGSANDYFDSVVERYNLQDIHKDGGHIYLGGQSKGGDETQSCILFSEYGYLIDAAYSIDGQGLSPKAVDYFIEKYGIEEFNRRRNKIYSINGENDPVHKLGIVIAPEENTYYLKVNAAGLLPWHDIRFLCYVDENGVWGLNWTRDENGNIINGEPGHGAKLGEEINKLLFMLDEDTRDGCATGLMGLIDLFSGKSLGSYKVEVSDWIDFFAYGVPILGYELFFTENGRYAIKELIHGLFEDNVNKHGIIVGSFITFVEVSAGLLIGIEILPILAYLSFVSFVIDFTWNMIKSALDTIDRIVSDFVSAMDSFYNAMVGLFGGITEYIKNNSLGMKYANNNPQIVVDTYGLRDYANRIESINKRLASLDARLDSLYLKVGLLDLWNLIQADVLTSYSLRLKNCSGYLNDTAGYFESAENSINSKI